MDANTWEPLSHFDSDETILRFEKELTALSTAYIDLPVQKLQDMCRERGLAVKPPKSALVERIASAQLLCVVNLQNHTQSTMQNHTKSTSKRKASATAMKPRAWASRSKRCEFPLDHIDRQHDGPLDTRKFNKIVLPDLR